MKYHQLSIPDTWKLAMVAIRYANDTYCYVHISLKLSYVSVISIHVFLLVLVRLGALLPAP